MTTIQLILAFVIIIQGILGQTTTSPPTSCSNNNNNLQMTPSLRQKILDAMNDARQMVKNGQMLLYNGKYALPAAEMPNLVWDCEKEEELHQHLQGSCVSYPSTNNNNNLNITWSYSGVDVGNKDTFVANGLYYSPKFGISYTYSLARSPIYTGTQESGSLNVYNSKAETLACAIYDCDISNKNAYNANVSTQLICTVNAKVEFGEAFYEVSSSVTNYIPPSQDVICPDSMFNIEHREMIMSKINEIRSKIANGNYELQNGNIALRALNLTKLVWSCEDEATMVFMASLVGCSGSPLYDHRTEFQKIVQPQNMLINPEDIKGYVNELIYEFFVLNSNFNFLAYTTIYAIEYPAVFALSDQATAIACHVKLCPNTNYYFLTDFYYICRVKPATQIFDLLYQV